MLILNILLPEQLKQYLDERLSEGRFSTASEYFHDLVRQDQKRRAQERLETLLLEGLESGEPVEVTDDYIQRKRADMIARLGSST